MKRSVSLSLFIACACSQEQEGIVFVDVTEEWGLDFVHDAGVTPEKHLPETMGAGAALADFDSDGDLDLYLIQGGELPVPGAVDDGSTNRLYRNMGDGQLVDATHAAGAAAHTGYGMGVAVGDCDGNGHLDMYLSCLGEDALLFGNGTGWFRDGTAASGVRDERWTAGCVFFDADQDGDLDLYVTGYLEVDLTKPTWCGEQREGWRSYCHPDHYEGLSDRYWRNEGDGIFVDGTAEAGLSDSTGKGLGAIPADFDSDGDLDLYVANDSTENRLWVNEGGGSFMDGTLLSGTGVNGRGLTEAGMGLASGDFDSDGDLDLYVTNFDDESNTLYRNEGELIFTDVTARSGLDAPTRMQVGFGTVAADFDSDGDLDIAVTNGHIIDNIELYHDGKTHAQRALMLLNTDGTFESVTAGDFGGLLRVGRCLLAGDLDSDGDLDLIETACGGVARIYRNDSASEGSTTTSAGAQPSYLGAAVLRD